MPGGPVDLAQGGNVIEELEYGNYPGVREDAGGIAKKVVADVVRGRTLVINADFCSGSFVASTFLR